MSARTIQTDEIKGLTGSVLIRNLLLYSAIPVTGDLADEDIPAWVNVLSAINATVPTPYIVAISIGTQLTAVTNEQGDATWAYQLDYTDIAYSIYGESPTIIVRSGATEIFVPNYLNGDLDIYLPDYDGTGLTTVSYVLTIKA